MTADVGILAFAYAAFVIGAALYIGFWFWTKLLEWKYWGKYRR